MDNKIDISTIPSNNNLETLMLNGVNFSMQMLASLLDALPQLKVLQICCTTLESPDKENVNNDQNVVFDQLTDLYMEACDLSSWSDCMFYAKKFPSLQKLHLSENGLKEIFEKCDQTNMHIKDTMSNLHTLSLNSCAIKDWKSIEALGALSSLQHLRIRDAPLFEDYDCETRHWLCVARIPSLQVCSLLYLSTNIVECFRV